MAGVDGLVKSVSYYLKVTDTTLENGTAADTAVLNELMVTEESVDLPTPALDTFEDDKENKGVEQGGLALRSGAGKGVYHGNQTSNQPPCVNTHLIYASNHHPRAGGQIKHLTKSVKLTKVMVSERVKILFPSDGHTPAVKPELPTIADKATNELAMFSFDASKTIKVIRGHRAREEIGSY